MSSCLTSTGSRWRSGWPAQATRRRWFWCRPGMSRHTGGGLPVARSAGSSRRATCRGMRFLRWSGEVVTGLAGGARMAAWSAGLVVGLGAEWLARSGQSAGAAVADLAVGWTLIGCGLLGWARRPQSRVGPLIALTGFAWFFGTLAESRIGFIAAIGGYALAAGPDRRARATAVAAAAALAIPLASGSVWRLLGGGSGAEHPV